MLIRKYPVVKLIAPGRVKSIVSFVFLLTVRPIPWVKSVFMHQAATSDFLYPKFLPQIVKFPPALTVSGLNPDTTVASLPNPSKVTTLPYDIPEDVLTNAWRK